MNLTVKVPGTCGELVQGTIDGQPFLVTCPINIWSTADVGIMASNHLLPKKSEEALGAVCKKLFIDRNHISIMLSSQLLRSKGMSSSSADIAAVCQAVALSQEKFLFDEEIAYIAAAIEPTDGVFCRGIVEINHLTGDILNYLGDPPPIRIAVFDCGGTVDTLSFNQRRELPELNKENEQQTKKALVLVQKGLKNGDTRAIGMGATISARANQKILYKDDLEDVISIAQKYGAVGVNVAHSGTLIGILFEKKQKPEIVENCIAAVALNCLDMQYLFCTDLISGGFFTDSGERLTAPKIC